MKTDSKPIKTPSLSNLCVMKLTPSLMSLVMIYSPSGWKAASANYPKRQRVLAWKSQNQLICSLLGTDERLLSLTQLNATLLNVEKQLVLVMNKIYLA